MRHVSILVPRGAAALGCIEGSFILFTKTNDFLAARGRQPLFKVQLVGLSGDAQVYDRLFSVRPEVTIERVQKTDLIIIPAVNGGMGEVISMNKGFLPWIVRQYKGGAEIASLCVGAFLLAATGLMKGKQCATHWLSANDFRRRFPDVKLVSESIITDEGGIYASKFYEIEIDRDKQSPFLIFKGQKDHADDAVKKAQELIEAGYRERITVDQLCATLAVGRRRLERRFKQATGNTVSEYIQRVRIEAAKKGLETGRKNVNEVMFEAGYSDTKAFREVFRRFAGMSPLDYRTRYNREAFTA
jgi:transcriptional regulator GlxA family with amidase domain